MREETGRNRVDLDEQASLEDMRAMLRDPSREEFVMRENVGREGAEAVELMPSTAALYVFGGTADGGALVGDLCRVDADGGAWALVGDGGRGSLAAPSARAGAAMAADDANVLWLFGGRTAAGWSSETFTLDTAQLPATDSPLPWASPELGGAAPAPREGHAMAWLCGRYLAVVGGSFGGAPLDEFVPLDALTLTWHVRAAPSLQPALMPAG